jgi:hypothetical protein
MDAGAWVGMPVYLVFSAVSGPPVDKSLHICCVNWVYLIELSQAENLSNICSSAIQKLTKRLSTA